MYILSCFLGRQQGVKMVGGNLRGQLYQQQKFRDCFFINQGKNGAVDWFRELDQRF